MSKVKELRNIYGTVVTSLRAWQSSRVSPLHFTSSKCSVFLRNCSTPFVAGITLGNGPAVSQSYRSLINKCFWTKSVALTRSYSQSPYSQKQSKNDDDKNEGREERQEEGSKRNNNNGNQNTERLENFLLAVLIIILLNMGQDVGGGVPEISFSVFLQQLMTTGEVRQLVVNNKRNKVFVFLHGGAVINGRQTSMFSRGPHYAFSISGVESFERKIISAQEQLGILPSARIPILYRSSTSDKLANAVEDMVFWSIIIIYLMSRFAKRGKSGISKNISMNPFNVISKADPTIITEHNRHSIRFKDVAGLKEAKVEVMEFVDYLKDPKRYTSLGARIPKGALLFGPPGTGKTMLARAIAAEANVPFLAMNGTDFVNMIGGVGASRMRDFFRQAREHAPCILYIDEIDTIGKSRSYGEHAEQESTLNQLLVEMDGINPLLNVVVMASTNRESVLDAALVRPGRFDRQVEMHVPTLVERKEIFEVYLKNIVLDSSKNLVTYASQLAALTPGNTGADIANIVNEAAIIAARHKGTSVTQKDLDKAIERVIAGLERKTQVMTPEEKEVVAYHEAGHALTGWLLEHTDPILKVSIVPRVKGMLGYSQHLPTDQKLYTTEQIFDRMCMTLGGRAAEALTFKKITTGASDDLDKVTKMAYRQVVEFGMSPRIGHISLPLRGSEPLSKSIYSQKLTKMIDEEVRHVVNEAYQRTESILSQNADTLKKLAESLLEKEVLNYNDIVNLAGEMPHKKKFVHLPSEIADHW